MTVSDLMHAGFTRRQAALLQALAGAGTDIDPASWPPPVRVAAAALVTPTAATAISTFPAHEPGRVLDGDINTSWVTANGVGGVGWITVQTPSVAITSYAVTACSNTDAASTVFTPSAWTLRGSNDNSSWTTLDIETGQVFTDNGQTRTYPVAGASVHTYYKLDATAVQGGPGYVGVGGMAFWQSPTPPSSGVGDLLVFNKGLWISTINSNTTPPGTNSDWTLLVQGV